MDHLEGNTNENSNSAYVSINSERKLYIMYSVMKGFQVSEHMQLSPTYVYKRS
jgi:hypothetical protein